MRIGFSIDPRQGLSEADELRLVELGAQLGYQSAWTPSGPDRAAFDRCVRWHGASGLPTGISVVPASGQPPAFYAEHAQRAWEGTGRRFTLGVGSGHLPDAAGEGLSCRVPLLLGAADHLHHQGRPDATTGQEAHLQVVEPMVGLPQPAQPGGIVLR